MFAIKRRLKLNNKEKTFFNGCAGYSRFVYNYGLGLLTEHRRLGGTGTNTKVLDASKKVFTNYTKKTHKYRWCNDYSSRIYSNAFIALKKAFTNWHEGRAKAPRFKKRKDGKSFTVDASNGKVLVSAGNKIKIPTLGTFRLHESLDKSYVSQTFTLSEQAGEWYISFAVDADKLPVPSYNKWEKCGVDLGIKCFATVHTHYWGDNIYESPLETPKKGFLLGTRYSRELFLESPQPYKKAKTKLRQLQWRNKNKVLGSKWIDDPTTKKRKKIYIVPSNNAKKYFQRLAKTHGRISNVRNDFLHKSSAELATCHNVIRLEDLNVKGMMQFGRLSAAIADQGFGEFRRQLIYKTSWAGGRVELVDRFYPSSKKCSRCGFVKPKLKLSERVYHCENCGHVQDRDENAAVNLCYAPAEVVRAACPEDIST